MNAGLQLQAGARRRRSSPSRNRNHLQWHHLGVHIQQRIRPRQRAADLCAGLQALRGHGSTGRQLQYSLGTDVGAHGGFAVDSGIGLVGAVGHGEGIQTQAVLRRHAVVVIAPAQMGDDGVLRGGRFGDFGVAGRQGLPAGRRGGESGRRRHQLCRCGCAAGNGRCLQALAFAGLLLMVLRALGGRCLGSGLLGRLVLDVLGLRTPHDAQRVDAEG